MYHISSSRGRDLYFLYQNFRPGYQMKLALKRAHPIFILVHEMLYNDYYSWVAQHQFEMWPLVHS